MSASVIDFPKANAAEHPARVESVCRSAFYLEGTGEPVFGWLHRHSTHPSIDHAVIICAPIGYEQIHAHRSLRHLADSLANRGIPTLRFDWHGTGDSPGKEEDPKQYQTWAANITQSIRWMRDKLGCRKVSLVGLRLGATLAALATLEHDVENLVLWSPIAKGKSFVREMKALSLTSDAPPQSVVASGNGIEAAGFLLNSETAADLSQIDLGKIHPHSKRTLVVSRAELFDDGALAVQWQTEGMNVQILPIAGYLDMMAEPHRSRVPTEGIQKITEWLVSAINLQTAEFIHCDDVCRTSACAMSIESYFNGSELASRSVVESPVTIAECPNLVGIVSEPATAVDDRLPTIVLLNAGSVHRVGPNRLYVHLTRELAARGYRCIRLDLNGLGDSICESVNMENDPYPATAFRDIDIAMKRVQSIYGSKRIVLMGLCSGAYAAFQAASLINNPSLVESILINPLTYFWSEGMTLDDSPTKHLRTFHYYQSVILDPLKWVKLFTGQSKIGVRGAFTLLARRLKILKASNPPGSSGSNLNRKSGLSHPQVEDLSGDLKRIANSGRKLAMFFSTTDPGYGILNFHAKRTAGRLQAEDQLRVSFIDHADHTFTRQSAREALIGSIISHLKSRYQ